MLFNGVMIILALLAGALLVLLLLAALMLWKQRQVQARNTDAEARLHLMAHALQSASDCICITDTSDRILFVNEAFLRTYEYQQRDVIGQHISIVRAPDNNAGAVDAILDATLRDGWRGVVRNVTRSGRVFPVSLATSTVRDEHGGVIAVVGVARDQTEEERAADALRASEEKYRQVVENAHDIIFTIDTEAYCTSMNRAGQNISGFVADTPRGIHLTRLVVPEQIDSALRQLQRVLADETVPRFELDIMTSQGKRRTLELDVRAIRIEDRIVGAQGIARDVTVRKELEAQLRQAQKMDAVGRLAGGIAHDFSNLLTVVMACADSAAQQLDAESAVRRDVEEIQQAVASAASLTRQLLTFSRKDVAHPAVLDLTEIVTRLNTMLQRLVGDDVHFVADLGSSVGHVKADAGQIEQVIVNLVVNARDAMPAGGTLTIETAAAPLGLAFASAHGVQPGDFVALTVADTGIGMTPEVRARIFEPFFTTKDPNKGTGLGLATVHGIVQQAGGCITVDSAPGRGTTFTIYLPHVSAPASTPAPSEPASDAPGQLGTVLYVEDEDSIRTFGARALRDRGFTVLTARHAADALVVLEQHGERIDLLLTNLVMPGLNGRALAELLRQNDPHLRVLYTSGNADPAALRDVQAGTAALLPKPYGPKALVREVQRALGR